MPSVTRGACKPPQSSLIQPLVIRQRPSHRGQSVPTALPLPSPCCLPDKKLSAATCAHPAGSGHHTEGSAPTIMPSAAQDPPQTSPQKKPNLEPAAGSPKPRLSPFPTGRAGGKQSGCRDAPGPPAEGLLHRVGAHAGVHVPGKHSEPGHLAFSGSGGTSMHRHSLAPTWAHGKDGGSDAPRPGEPQAWRWLQAGKGWKLNVMGHAAEGSDAGE